MATYNNSAWSDEHRDRERIWKGVVAGAAAGLIASYVMNRFQEVLSAATSEKGQSQQQSSRADRSLQESQRDSENGDDATQRTANSLVKPVIGRSLTRHEKETAGPIVHYMFGSMMGGLYGGMAEMSRNVSSGWGMPFGAALWLSADEVAVPALGLGQSPTETPLSTHASALLAHLVYGATTGVVHRVVRRAIA